jgi:hypothetical protein
MTTPNRSIRLLGKNSTELNTLTGESGELFYDSTSGVLRLYNGATQGGFKLVTQPFVTNSITTALASYATTANLTSLLSAKVDTSSLTTLLSAKVNTSSLTAFSSNLVPQSNTTYNLGSASYNWNNLYVNKINDLIFSRVEGRTYYVTQSGDDTSTGTSIQGAFATVKKALTVATAGDSIKVGAGTYTEIFPLTVPAGVSIVGLGIRSTKIVPTV